MNEEMKEKGAANFDRRDFLKVGAAGAAGLAVAGMGMQTAWAQPKPRLPVLAPTSGALHLSFRICRRSGSLMINPP